MKCRIALGQMMPYQEVEKNYSQAETMLDEAAAGGADFLVLPEMWTCGFSEKNMRKNPESEGGRAWQILSEGARRHHMYVVGGTIPIPQGDKFLNRCFFFDRQGNCTGSYDKTHMFDLKSLDGSVNAMESAYTIPGDHIQVIDTEFGKIGLTVCYDLRFPELYIATAQQGAGIIFNCAAFTNATGQYHWTELLKVRAIDCTSFIAAVCAAYDGDSPMPCYGHSGVADPYGELLGQMDGEPGLKIVEIETDRIEEVRGKLQVLRHQRRDLY